jgi:hypothetical protein
MLTVGARRNTGCAYAAAACPNAKQVEIKLLAGCTVAVTVADSGLSTHGQGTTQRRGTLLLLLGGVLDVPQHGRGGGGTAGGGSGPWPSCK